MKLHRNRSIYAGLVVAFIVVALMLFKSTRNGRHESEATAPDRMSDSDAEPRTPNKVSGRPSSMESDQSAAQRVEKSQSEPASPIALGAIQIAVVDTLHRPLPGSHIVVRYFASTGSQPPTQECDSANDGRIEMQGCAINRAAQIKVSHPGYATLDRHYVSLPSVIEFVLLPDEAIEGTVVMDQKGSPAPGVDIVAWPFDHPEECTQRVLQVAGGKPTEGHAVSDDAGHFRVNGLPSGQRFSLIAGGNGMISDAPVRFVWAGKTGVKLRVWPAYGVHVRYQEQSGAPIQVKIGEYSMGATSFHLDRAEGRIVLGLDSTKALAGVPVQYCRNMANPEPDGYMFIALAEEWKPKVGPITYTLNVPGYASRPVYVDALPLRNGVAEEAVSLVPIVSEWGTVQLTMRGMQAQPLTEQDSGRYLGSLRLSSKSQVVDYDVRVGLDGRPRPLRVPQGDYVASFENFPLIAWPAKGVVPLHVGTETTALDVDLGESGSLELRFVSQDGSEYAGAAALDITHFVINEDGSHAVGGSGTCVVSPPEYRLAPMAVGAYRIRVLSPATFELETPEECNVEIVSGRSTIIRLKERQVPITDDDR